MSEKPTAAQVESAKEEITVETNCETVETTNAPQGEKTPDTEFKTYNERIANVYGCLTEIRDGFNKAVLAFRDIQKFDEDLRSVAKWYLPSEVDTVDIENPSGLCDYSLTNEGYAKWLTETLACRNNLQRMKSLAQLARMLREGIKDLGRKDKKLTERIKLQGSKTAEGRVSVTLRCKVRDGITILEGRLGDVCDKFYLTRKRMMHEVASLTKEMYDNISIDTGKDKGKFPSDIVDRMRRSAINEELTDIERCDRGMDTMTNAKYRYNPFSL